MSTHQTRSDFLKKCFQRSKILICVLVVCLALCSCYEQRTDEIATRVDSNVLEQIRQSIEDKSNVLLADEGDVFWMPGGTTWHLSYECYYIEGSEEILHGSEEEAKTAGKSKACKICAQQEEEYESPDGFREEYVFWTKTGTTWHVSTECRYIVNTKNNIYYGTIEDAQGQGKERACSVCSK